MAAKKTDVTIGGRTIALSNADKVLWPRDGFTKGQLVAYYRSVAKWLVPHLRDRPLTLQRWPDGIDEQSFFEKQAPRFTPDWIPTVSLSADQQSRKISYLLCNDEATLAWCANLASIVLHVWYSHVPTPESPDYVLFDLDTCENTTLGTLARVALEFRDVLARIGLPSLVKTSGGSGFHLAVPLKNHYDFDTARRFAEITVEHVAAALPGLTTVERTIKKRPKTAVYLDWGQVGRGKTVVPPYVVRARDGAPVSVPLDWNEVEALVKKRGSPEAFIGQWSIENVRKRLESVGDLWGGRNWKPAKLEPALAKAQRAWAP
ncbi:MAG TPA: non-homologous end-joining DNA ligase [Candidatus Baltobacteraceae bacterium]|nr:non-homologous end-joining DNA ligase [Candidatus Baltobacteraceae bacterium]